MDDFQDLNDLLKTWSNSRAASPVKLAELQQKILTDISSSRPVSLSRNANGTARKNRGWPVLLAALCLVICFYALWKSPPVEDAPVRAIPAYAKLDATELRNHEILLRETSQLFDHQLSWLAETQGQVEMGILDRELQSDSKPIAVRLVVERRRPDESEWSLLCEVDVLAYSEEIVQVTPTCEHLTQLTLWSYVLPDGLIAIDTDFSVGVGTIAISTSQLHQDAAPLKVSAAHDDQYEFRVFQSASML